MYVSSCYTFLSCDDESNTGNSHPVVVPATCDSLIVKTSGEVGKKKKKKKNHSNVS